jgi:hypothetical protein
VQVNPSTPILAGFNKGLIVGPSTIISTATRTKRYANLAAMYADGFRNTMPEYNAAALYFSQTPTPQQVVIGCYSSGTDANLAAAVTACRASDSSWYACTCCNTTIADCADADILAVAAVIEAAAPLSCYFATTNTAAVLVGTGGNLGLALQGLGYRRTFLQYSAYIDAAAAIMGYAMGANLQAPGSAFTLFGKSEIGVTPDALTEGNLGVLQGQNTNYYINRANTYNLLEQGKMVGGLWFDLLLGLDILVTNIQTSIMSLLTSLPKIPLTDGGVALLVNACANACQQLGPNGGTSFLGPKVWTATGITVGSTSVNTGDMLPAGYKILAAPVSSLTSLQTAARQAPAIVVACTPAGAVQNVSISIVANS